MSTSNGLMFGENDIRDMRDRTARLTWAAKALGQIRWPLEMQREELLAGTSAPPKAGAKATALFELALCSRLVENDWHREAAISILEGITNLPGFAGHLIDRNSGFDYGLNGLAISGVAKHSCLALDFLKDVPDRLRQRLVERVLIPIAERLDREVRRGGSNWQVMENYALLCVGLVTDRQQYVDIVGSDPERGFPYHLTSSVHPDGFWYEQSLGYHIGTTANLLKTQWIARRNGIDLGGDDVLQRMLGTVARMALPGGQLPLLSDAHPLTMFEVARLFEIGYAMYPTPSIGWLLERSDRSGLWSLLVGREIESREPPAVHSELFDASGVCVLKSGTAPEYWDGKGAGATVTFGPHGDWHGHPGKLGLEYWQDGAYLVRDRGVGSGYALPMHREWFATTLAHSTLVVDGRQQHFTNTSDRPELEANERGFCHAHLLRDPVSACTVSADFAYPGFSVKRTLFQTPEYLLDIVECAADDGREHTFDWVCHSEGMIRTELPFARGTLGYDENGYDFVRRVEALDTGDDWHLDLMHCQWCDSSPYVTGEAMRLSMLGEPGTTVFTGLCPSWEHDRYSPVVIVRRDVARTVFVTLFVPESGELLLERLRNDGGAIVCKVAHPEGFTDVLAKQDTAGELPLDQDTTTNALLAYVRSGADSNAIREVSG